MSELESRFPNPSAIDKESDKKAFVKLFGEYLKGENILRNYDEFAALKALQEVDARNPEAIECFKAKHYLNDDVLHEMQKIHLPPERKTQDYRSTYNDIRDWLRQEKSAADNDKSGIDWDDVVFEVDLLKSQEINLEYILELIFEKNKKSKDKVGLIEEARRAIRASIGNRAKESLIVDFINQTDLDRLDDKLSLIDAFFAFAREEQRREVDEIITSEDLHPEAAKRYIKVSVKREFASENGADLNAILPKMSPLNPKFRSKKMRVFERISEFVDKFKGVGGEM